MADHESSSTSSGTSIMVHIHVACNDCKFLPISPCFISRSHLISLSTPRFLFNFWNDPLVRLIPFAVLTSTLVTMRAHSTFVCATLHYPTYIHDSRGADEIPDRFSVLFCFVLRMLLLYILFSFLLPASLLRHCIA